MPRPEKIRLGEILVLQKLLSQEQLTFSLEEQKRSGRKLGRVFVENGFVTEEGISGALARQFAIPYIDLKHTSHELRRRNREGTFHARNGGRNAAYRS